MKTSPDIHIRQCPASKTETTIPNRRNLIQGIVYTGDRIAEEPNKGDHEATQISESSGAAVTSGAKHHRKWFSQRSKVGAIQWDLNPEQGMLSRSWHQGRRSNPIRMGIESWKKCQRSRPMLERGADKYLNLPSSLPVVSH